MRDIHKIIVHCADTPANRFHDAADLRKWHKHRGFSDIGYHYVVLLDGTIQKGREDKVTGAHCKGHNSTSIGVCYIGGKGEDTRTESQSATLIHLITFLKRMYPEAEVFSHSDFSSKKCPQFNAKMEYADL